MGDIVLITDTVLVMTWWMELWQRETEELLANARYGKIAESGPWMSLAQRVPAEHVSDWWNTVAKASGWVAPTWAGCVPGGGKIRHVVFVLAQRPDVPFAALNEVPLGLLGDVVHSLSHPQSGWTPEGFSDRLDEAYGSGVSRRLLQFAWSMTTAPWYGCHHRLGDVLPLLADEAALPLEACLAVHARFRDSGWMGVPETPQDLRRELISALTGSGLEESSVRRLGRCRPTYPDPEVQAAVNDAELQLLIHAGYVPCGGSLLELGQMLNHSPVTRTAADLLTTTRLPIAQAFETAVALESR